MILYNGSTGGLGRYMDPALSHLNVPRRALGTRLEDREGLMSELARIQLDDDPVLLQLAARVSVAAGEADPAGTMELNVTHTINTVLGFVTWADGLGRRPRVLYVSTGHVYEAHASGHRLPETAPTRPRSVYARSKLLAEETLGRLAEDRGFALTIARVFGLIAPRQPASYVLPGLIRRVREDRLSGVPGLDHIRDYLDARDVCADLAALATTEQPMRCSVLNVCSGQGTSIRELLNEVLRAAGSGNENDARPAATPAPGRADDIPWIVGDPSRLIGRLGGLPTRRPLAATVREAWEQAAGNP